jgi:hypothetical protein
MVVQAVIIHFLWGKDLRASHDAEERVMAMNPRRLRQSDGRRHRRAQQGAVQVHHLYAVRLPDDAGVGGDL